MGGGLRLGWQGHFMDDTLSFGAVYQTKIFMTEFDDYRGLFPDAGTLELPATFSLGSAFKPTPELTIAFDWVHVFYESVRALGNRSLPITTIANDPNLMGQKGGPGFGWENQDVFKIGLQYDLNPEWTIRGGVAYGKNPIKKGGGEFEFNVLAPVVTELHLTAGGTYKYGAKHEISFAIMHAFNNSETEFLGAVDLPFINQDITLEMEQWTWDFGYGYKF
jgi:long-chain fatty acid transport protein